MTMPMKINGSPVSWNWLGLEPTVLGMHLHTTPADSSH